ncbi:MAG: hypothetical protein ACRD3W_24280, partial [Terriglobales bacterium]
AVHRLLGLNVNDPADTLDLIKFRASSAALQLHEDQAGNVLHLSLFLASLTLVLFWRKGRAKKELLRYAVCILTGFLIMCACLKWSLWNNRYHIPLFVLAAAFTGVALQRLPQKHAAAISALLLICAVPYICLNATKPLLGDQSILVTSYHENYFRSVPNYYAPYVELTNFLSQHQLNDIGVANPDNGWCEYPLWVFLSDDFKHPVSIRSSTFEGLSTYEKALPQALVSFERKCPSVIKVGQAVYLRRFTCFSQNDSWTYSLLGHQLHHRFPPFYATVLLPEADRGHHAQCSQ